MSCRERDQSILNSPFKPMINVTIDNYLLQMTVPASHLGHSNNDISLTKSKIHFTIPVTLDAGRPIIAQRNAMRQQQNGYHGNVN